MMNFTEGEILYIDKPLTWTSFDVVNKIRLMLRKHLGIKKIKVGHAGTLDPLATGLVVVCTGRKTKLIEQLMSHDKEYVATLRFGQTTPSFDLETQVDAEFPYEHITREGLQKAIDEYFTGEIDQVPPLFSAIRIDGKRAYEHARKGDQSVELKSRRISISNIEILSFDLPLVTIKINCGKGTYIRSLARDLGTAMNSGAHLTALRRIKVGDATIDEALTIDDVECLIKQQTSQKEKLETIIMNI